MKKNFFLPCLLCLHWALVASIRRARSWSRSLLRSPSGKRHEPRERLWPGAGRSASNSSAFLLEKASASRSLIQARGSLRRSLSLLKKPCFRGAEDRKRETRSHQNLGSAGRPLLSLRRLDLSRGVAVPERRGPAGTYLPGGRAGSAAAPRGILTTPPLSPSMNWTIWQDDFSQRKMCPQSLPLTTNSLLGP